MSDHRVTLAELIQRRRDQLGLSDEQAAEELGVAQATFSRWRSGRFIPDEDRLAEVATWLQKPEDEVALAMVHGRRNRPPASERITPAEVRSELDELRARIARLEREAGQAP